MCWLTDETLDNKSLLTYLLCTMLLIRFANKKFMQKGGLIFPIETREMVSSLDLRHLPNEYPLK